MPAKAHKEKPSGLSTNSIKSRLSAYARRLGDPDLSLPQRSVICEHAASLFQQAGDLEKALIFYDYAIYADPTSESAYKKKLALYDVQSLPKRCLSVVIPTFNRCQDLIRCISSVRRNSVFPVQIVVVAEKCDGATVEFIREENKKENFIGLVNDSRLGCIASAKIGFMAAQGDYIAGLNDDVKVMPGWDVEAILAIDNDATAACAVPLVVNHDGTAQFVGQHSDLYSDKYAWLGSVPSLSHLRAYGKNLLQLEPHLQRRDCNYGWFTVVKKDCLEAIGFLDQNYRHYYVDVDNGYLIQQRGWRNVFCPTSILVHYHKSMQELGNQGLHDKMMPDKRYFIKKWHIATPIDAF